MSSPNGTGCWRSSRSRAARRWPTPPRRLSARQRGRLIAAAEILLAAHPGWGPAGVRFDVVVVDAAGRVRRIADAFRQED